MSSRRAPYPPFELANRVFRLSGDDQDGFSEYEELGRQTRNALIGLLPADFDFAGKAMLDFGCGAGRTLRHFLPEAERGDFWGVDIDAPSIDWLQANLCPPLNAIRGEVDPPLPFEDGRFDFAWAISVFTHLAGNSADWLLELHRVLKPGGLLMASYMGKFNSEVIALEPWEEDRIGMNVLFRDRPWNNGGPMVLMSDWWVDEHWGRAFDVLKRFDFHGQTWTLLRRKDVRLTPAELLEPSDDPRESRAIRHNLLQVQRAHGWRRRLRSVRDRLNRR